MIAAYRELVAELLKLAGDDSPLAGLDRDEVGAVDGGLAGLNETGGWESYAEILGRAGPDEVSAEAAAPPLVEADVQDTGAMTEQSAHATQSAVILDIGGDIGALVLYTGAEDDAAEIDISPGTDPAAPPPAPSTAPSTRP